jgi:hypothetical protein
MHIVQNVRQVANGSISKQSVADQFFSFTGSAFMPLWLQPGLIARSPNRGDRIEIVSFFGNPEQFPAEEIQSLTNNFASKGIQFHLKLRPDEWIDYTDTDITLALRSFGKNPHYNKPISKLVNAVLCNTLVIAGDESSNRYFRRKYFPELPIVSSQQELLIATDKLLANPAKAFEEIGACRERLGEINTLSLVKNWETLLVTASKYAQRWNRLNAAGRKVFFATRSL